MKSKEFLTTKLEILYKNFPESQIRYEYKAATNTHVVEVLPIELYAEDPEYANFEVLLEEEFESLFPSEEILFVSENSLTKIGKAEKKYGYTPYRFNIQFSKSEVKVEEYCDTLSRPTYEENNYALAA